jgi:hypothetical protein
MEGRSASPLMDEIGEGAPGDGRDQLSPARPSALLLRTGRSGTAELPL